MISTIPIAAITGNFFAALSPDDGVAVWGLLRPPRLFLRILQFEVNPWTLREHRDRRHH